MNAEPKICKQCGAPLKRTTFGYKCEYCGTSYEEDKATKELKIISVNAPVKVYRSKIEIDMLKFILMKSSSKDPKDFVIKKLTQRMVEYIAKEIEIVEEHDIVEDRMRYIATLRVVDPSFRF